MRRKRQLTMPLHPFEEAGLQVGDRLRARAAGDGKVLFERIDERARAAEVPDRLDAA